MSKVFHNNTKMLFAFLRSCPNQFTKCPWPVDRQLPLPCPFPGLCILHRQRTSARTVCKFGGKQWQADHWCQHKIQYHSGRSQGFEDPSQKAVGLVVIYDFCWSPQSQNWQQICYYSDLIALCLTETGPHLLHKWPVTRLFSGNLVPFCAFLGAWIQQQTTALFVWPMQSSCIWENFWWQAQTPAHKLQ